MKLAISRWVLIVCGKHVLIEGFAIGPDNKPQLYRTNPVLDVIDCTVVYTTSRSYYRLNGPLNVEATVQGGVSLWFAKRFIKGFPKNWKEIFDLYFNYMATHVDSKSSDTLEMMSLLSCEGFALKQRDVSLWSNRNILSDQCSPDANVDDSFGSPDVDLDITVQESKKKTVSDSAEDRVTVTPKPIASSRRNIAYRRLKREKVKKSEQVVPCVTKKKTHKKSVFSENPSNKKRFRTENDTRLQSLKSIDQNPFGSRATKSKNSTKEKKNSSSKEVDSKSKSQILNLSTFYSPS